MNVHQYNFDMDIQLTVVLLPWIKHNFGLFLFT